MNNCGWCGEAKAAGDHSECIRPLRAMARRNDEAAVAALALADDERETALRILESEPPRRSEYLRTG